MQNRKLVCTLVLNRGQIMLRKKLKSFRLKFEIDKMLNVLSKKEKKTKTEIIEMLIVDYYLKKNQVEPK